MNVKLKCKIHHITLFQGQFDWQFDEIWCQLCQAWKNVQTEIDLEEF